MASLPPMKDAVRLMQGQQSSTRSSGSGLLDDNTRQNLLAELEALRAERKNLTSRRDAALDESNAGILETMKNNPVDTIQGLVRAILLTGGGGAAGALMGLSGMLGNAEAKRDMKADEAAGLTKDIMALQETRANRLLQLMVANPEVLLEEGPEGLRSIVDPITLGDAINLGMPVNPAMLSRVRNLGSAYSELLPKFIEKFDELDTNGRAAMLGILRDTGMHMTDEQVEALAVNEARTVEQWGEVFDPYTVAQGVIWAEMLGLHPSEGLSDPRVIHHMAVNQPKDATPLTPSQARENMVMDLWRRLDKWLNANQEKALQLRNDPEDLLTQAGFNTAEMAMLVQEYKLLGEGLTDAEVQETIAESFVEAMRLSNTIAAVNKDAAEKLVKPEALYEFVESALRQALTGAGELAGQKRLQTIRARAEEIVRESNGTISPTAAVLQAAAELEAAARAEAAIDSTQE